MARAFEDIDYEPEEKKPVNNAVPGTILNVTIHVENWYSDGDSDELHCGAFEIDSCDFSGPPDKMVIKAVSTPISSSLRREEKCRPWQNATLKKIAEDIAGEAELELVYDVQSMLEFDRVDQLQKSDLSFLMELCHKYGVSVKASDKKLILFEEREYEKKEPVGTFDKTDTEKHGRIISYRFSQDTSGTCSKVALKYSDPKSGKQIQVQYEPPNPPATGQKAVLNDRPGNLSGDPYREKEASGGGGASRAAGSYEEFPDTIDDFEAIRADANDIAILQAKAEARNKNKPEWTANVTMVGNVNMVGGVTFEMTNFGVYSGKYYVDSATHKVSSSGGYTTEIKAHKVLGY